jgi:hypothetical protein
VDLVDPLVDVEQEIQVVQVDQVLINLEVVEVVLVNQEIPMAKKQVVMEYQIPITGSSVTYAGGGGGGGGLNNTPAGVAGDGGGGAGGAACSTGSAGSANTGGRWRWRWRRFNYSRRFRRFRNSCCKSPRFSEFRASPGTNTVTTLPAPAGGCKVATFTVSGTLTT